MSRCCASEPWRGSWGGSSGIFLWIMPPSHPTPQASTAQGTLKSTHKHTHRHTHLDRRRLIWIGWDASRSPSPLLQPLPSSCACLPAAQFEPSLLFSQVPIFTSSYASLLLSHTVIWYSHNSSSPVTGSPSSTTLSNRLHLQRDT